MQCFKFRKHSLEYMDGSYGAISRSGEVTRCQCDECQRKRARKAKEKLAGLAS